MSRKQAFARRLSEAATTRGLTPRQIHEETGIDYKRLCRWLSDGISRPTNKTAGDLETLRQYFGLKSVGQLWTGSEESERYGEKVRRLLDAPLPAEHRRSLCQYIDALWPIHELLERMWALRVAVKGAARAGRPEEKHFAILLQKLQEGASPDELVEQLAKRLERKG